MALQCSFGKHPGVRQLGGEARGWLVAAKILLGPWVPGLCLPWGAAERPQHRWHTRAGTFGASCSPQRGAGQLKVSEHSSLVSVLPSLGQLVKGAAVLCSGGPCVNGASPWGAFPGPLGIVLWWSLGTALLGSAAVSRASSFASAFSSLEGEKLGAWFCSLHQKFILQLLRCPEVQPPHTACPPQLNTSCSSNSSSDPLEMSLGAQLL